MWRTAIRLAECDRVGQGTRALGRLFVRNDGRIEIGCDATIRSGASPVRLETSTAGTIVVGDRVTIEPGATIFSDCEVRIEDDVVIGPNVTICDRDERGVAREIVIEAGARIGANAFIGSGCRVRRGTVVAPGDRPADEVARTVRTAPPRRSATKTLSALLVADFTIDELAPMLAEPDFDGLAIASTTAPFDQVVPTLLGLAAGESKQDAVLAWTRPESVAPAFRAMLHGEAVDERALTSEVDAFASAVIGAAGAVRFVLVPSWVLPPWRRGLGMLELRDGPTATLARMNQRLADAFASTQNVFLLDTQRWLAAARDGGVDPKLWHAGKMGFTRDVLTEAAHDVRAALRGLGGGARKLVVLDLDDTLWGGIVGDVGWQHLRLGGHDAHGEAFVELQKKLVALAKRGIALAIVSKNEESVALEAMERHPEMILRPDMLAAHRIGWTDKAQSVAEIAAELNLGLQSVVFIDDNPVERARVREALPEVYVPEWPSDPTHYPRALESLRCFDTPRVTSEDRERNAMYATERKRTALRATTTSLEEWLETLGLVVRFERLAEANVARAAQLLNKTNQMNLRTRRLSEGELLAWAKRPEHEAWVVRVADRFGDAGLTGFFALACTGEKASLEDYLLSCRVMGRRVEQTMLWAAAQRAAARGARELVIEPLATPKNKPCLDFFENAGFPRRGDAWVVDVAGGLEAPRVSVEGLSS
ncbi:MAG TPA: HAD-IIIC family phosphatase [Polyangiaceae bacterium]|jgi:FkbH-like protein